VKSSQKLTLEIRKLNQKLDQIGSQTRFMIYSANPAKFAFYNFIAGAFHSLGSLFGTFIIFGILAYIFSQLDLNNTITQWFTEVFSNIDWQQIIPKIETNNPLNQNSF
jgi:hypothetical protein